jgi:hypothetical protein
VIPVDQVREALGLGSEYDTTLVRLIKEATATLGRALNRYLGEPVDRVEVKCGGQPGNRVVFLVDEPLDPDTPDSVEVETRTDPFSAWEPVAAEDFAMNGRQVLARNHFPPGPGTVRVTYRAGYEIGAGPEELRDLVRQLVQIRWTERGATGLMQSETLGDYSYTRGDLERLDNWKEVVGNWRRRLA